MKLSNVAVLENKDNKLGDPPALEYPEIKVNQEDSKLLPEETRTDLENLSDKEKLVIKNIQEDEGQQPKEEKAPPAKKGFFVDHILPNLHELYGVSTVFSWTSAVLGMIPQTKKISDILQRVGYCLDTGAHQLRGIFSKGESMNLGMMLHTATAFIGTVAFENKSFWGQLTRNLGNLCHLGILKDMLDFAKEFPKTLPEGSQENIERITSKFSGKSSINLVQDFKNSWLIAIELAKEVFTNPNIAKSITDSIAGKDAKNIPHVQALSALSLAGIGAASIVTKTLGLENIAWKLNKSLALLPTLANLSRAKSYSTMDDPGLVEAGKYCEIGSWGTLASAVTNFKFEDLAMAMRALFMGCYTLSFRKEAEKIFKNAQTEMQAA